jgi:antitoxin MazE
MEVSMQISKWGNSLAVRLPAALVEELGLKEGDEIELKPVAEHAFEVTKASGRIDLLHGLRKYRGSLPADYKFNREELYDRTPDREK